MYHYVRDIKKGKYPEIKGLEYSLFCEQIHYLNKNYCIISIDELIAHVYEKTKLPENAVLLTFDDGYIDHYKYVFPLLDSLKIKGSFYIPAQTIAEHKVLDVNKIHFILVLEPDKKKLIKQLFQKLNFFRRTHFLPTDDEYIQKFAQPGRFDDAEVVLFKKLLQYELPAFIREAIVNDLFSYYIKEEEAEFAKKLYLNPTQIQEMNKHGMHFGGHGYSHIWLGKQNETIQEIEIQHSFNFLNSIVPKQKYYSFCYPFGSYNSTTIDLLNKFGFRAAITTEVALADLNKNNIFLLPRLDTNDVPKQKNDSTNIFSKFYKQI